MNSDTREEARSPVVIIGAGPSGLALALGLARQGVRSVLVEQGHGGMGDRSKAPAIHARTLEILRGWGVERAMLDGGQLVTDLRVRSADTAGRTLVAADFSELDDEAEHPGVLFVDPGVIERVLLRAVSESGQCDVRFGTELVGLDTRDDGVTLTVDGPRGTYRISAEFVVGCDGASGFVRGALRLPFEGAAYPIRPVLADVRVGDDRDALPWPRLRNERGGLLLAIRLRPGLWRLARLNGGDLGRAEEVSDEEVAAMAEAVLGPGEVGTVWASRYRIHRRWSPHFRVGRVLLAGDAAHVHPPMGGQGMNAGIHDAANLAWKLAQALSGRGEVERLLESYDEERRGIASSVSWWANLNTRLFLQMPPAVRGGILRLAPLLAGIPPLRRSMLRRMTMLNLTCPLSPLLDYEERAAGKRLPNPLLRSPGGGRIRLYDLLPSGPALVEVAIDRAFGADVDREALPLSRVVRIGPGGHDDPTDALRRLLGAQEGWILVRPDGHVAWARQRPEGMADAVRRALGEKG
ncbi:FAD-dependent monooxygenase [Halostreptopolyspora alba]